MAPSPGDASLARRPLTSLEGDQLRNLRQVIQHFFSKGALTVISSRTNLPQSFVKNTNNIKIDKWFGMILDDTDVLHNDLSIWDGFDVQYEKPPPMFIEVYLDTAELPRNQTLVIRDERGRRWDACEALESPAGSASRSRRRKNVKVVLERWKLELGSKLPSDRHPFPESMSTVYKKATILFRSLYTYTRFLPAWSFTHRLAKQPATLTSLRPMYSITTEDPTKQPHDTLYTRLYPTEATPASQYAFSKINTPAGPMCVDVSYRTNCDFTVDDAEALLSSHLLGMDNREFRPSLPDQRSNFRRSDGEPGSLPADKRGLAAQQEGAQAYGSMSTFHQVGGATGTSPISALRAARDFNSESLGNSPPTRVPPDHRSSQSSKSSLRPVDPPGQPFQRRVSVSFQPFKAGSLSSSPVPGGYAPTSPRPISGEASSPAGNVTHTRNRSSLSGATPSSLKAMQTLGVDTDTGSAGSGSPKAPPLTRYSSSFGNRRSRFSSASSANTKADEDNNSSGKGSQSSSNQPGSGLLAEGEGGSPSSLQTDDSNISDFLKLLEQKKDLKSFNRTDDASRDASARRNTASLSKFRGMRDSHAALTDSLSASMIAQQPQPSSMSSRQASSLPPQLAGNSVSTSSSPGKPVSPHTPHTPVYPSRLSLNATVDENEAEETLHTGTQRPPREASAGTPHGTTAIDIPISPQRFPHVRRPSSSNPRDRVIEDEFGMRTSVSMPLDDRSGADLSMSELFALNDAPGGLGSAPQRIRPRGLSSTVDEDGARPSSAATNTDAERDPPPPQFRSRLSRGGGGSSGGRGSNSSIGTGSGVASGSVERGSGRYSFSARPGAAAMDDDEPLLFTMSELGGQSRRNADESGGNGGDGGRERGGSGSSANRRGMW